MYQNFLMSALLCQLSEAYDDLATGQHKQQLQPQFFCSSECFSQIWNHHYQAHSLIISDTFQSISHSFPVLSHSLPTLHLGSSGSCRVWLVQDVDDDDGFVKAPRALHQGYDANEARFLGINGWLWQWLWMILDDWKSSLANSGQRVPSQDDRMTG